MQISEPKTEKMRIRQSFLSLFSGNNSLASTFPGHFSQSCPPRSLRDTVMVGVPPQLSGSPPASSSLDRSTGLGVAGSLEWAT